jgi:hypothetical protein
MYFHDRFCPFRAAEWGTTPVFVRSARRNVFPRAFLSVPRGGMYFHARFCPFRRGGMYFHARFYPFRAAECIPTSVFVRSPNFER